MHPSADSPSLAISILLRYSAVSKRLLSLQLQGAVSCAAAGEKAVASLLPAQRPLVPIKCS